MNIKNLGVMVEFILLKISILLLVVKTNKPNPQCRRKFKFIRFDYQRKFELIMPFTFLFISL